MTNDELDLISDLIFNLHAPVSFAKRELKRHERNEYKTMTETELVRLTNDVKEVEEQIQSLITILKKYRRLNRLNAKNIQ